jgi:hypothetical protein
MGGTSDSVQVKIPCYSLARIIYINFFFVIILVFRIYLFLLRHAFNLRGIDLVEAEKTRLHNGEKKTQSFAVGD